MFDRPKYKEFARIQLKKRWTIPVLMTLFGVAVSQLFQIPSNTAIARLASTVQLSDFLSFYKEFTNQYKPSAVERACTWISMLVMPVIMLAQIRVYIKMSKSPDPVHFSDFIEGFSSWWRAVLAMLWQTLWIVLWSLLFIIPGIVKMFSYSQMMFLVAEYPDLSVIDALTISRKMTNGYKWHLFVMSLSFLGWGLLSLLTLGIGWLWLEPYMTMSFTNAYHAMLKHALEANVISMDDLKK